MKATINGSSATTLVLTTAVILLFAVQCAVAQKPGLKAFTANKYAVENLAASICSSNPGVRKSAIYLAGYYGLAEAVASLTQQLSVEKDAVTRILIGLSLYQIGDSTGLDAVNQAALRDSDPRAKRMLSAIYAEYKTTGGNGGNLTKAEIH